MKLSTNLISLFVLVSLLAAACGDQGPPEEDPLPSATLNNPDPTSVPAAESPSASAETSTLEPLPSPTSAPALPENLTQINYRTLEGVEELAAISLPDVIELEFSPDHRYLRLRLQISASIHRDVIFDLQQRKDIFSLEGKQRIYFNPDSSSIAALDSSGVTLIDLASIRSQKVYNSRYPAAALSPDGRTLVEVEVAEGQVSGTNLHVIDLTTGEERYQLYINAVLDREVLQFDDDGELLAGSYLVPPSTYVSTVWRVRTGVPIYTIYGYDEIALHPFGSEVALSNAKRDSISLVSTVSWGQKLYLGTDQNGPGFRDVSYSAGGRLIYALSAAEIAEPYFWFPPSGERLEFHPGLDLLAVTVSPDRLLLATSGKDGKVVIWGIPE